jgi:hypothetical protein
MSPGINALQFLVQNEAGDLIENKWSDEIFLEAENVFIMNKL